MWRLKPIAGWACRFGLVFAMLVAPWPGWHAAVSRYVRVSAGFVLGGEREGREVTFEPAPGRPDDTRIVIVNRALIAPDGSGPIRNLDLDLGALEWQPMALFLALVVATPVPWRRRLRAATIGVLLLQLCLFSLISYCLWVESAEVRLVDFGEVTGALAKLIEEAAVSQFGLALPLLLGIVVALRREDIARWVASARTANIPPPEPRRPPERRRSLS